MSLKTPEFASHNPRAVAKPFKGLGMPCGLKIQSTRMWAITQICTFTLNNLVVFDIVSNRYDCALTKYYTNKKITQFNCLCEHKHRSTIIMSKYDICLQIVVVASRLTARRRRCCFAFAFGCLVGSGRRRGFKGAASQHQINVF